MDLIKNVLEFFYLILLVNKYKNGKIIEILLTSEIFKIFFEMIKFYSD